MRALNIVKFSAALLGAATIAAAGPAFAAHPGGGHIGGGHFGGHFSAGANVGAPGLHANAAPMTPGPNHTAANWNRGRFGHGHGYGYGGGFSWGYGGYDPDYAYGYDPYDEGYADNGYDQNAGAEGSYCQTPVRSCGISEPATVGTPCGCQNSAGTVWGQVQ